MMELLYTIGIVLAVLSVPVNIVGMCKYGWFGREPGYMAFGLFAIAYFCFVWFLIIPIALVSGLMWLICKGIIALCPNKPKK